MISYNEILKEGILKFFAINVNRFFDEITRYQIKLNQVTKQKIGRKTEELKGHCDQFMNMIKTFFPRFRVTFLFLVRNKLDNLKHEPRTKRIEILAPNI